MKIPDGVRNTISLAFSLPALGAVYHLTEHLSLIARLLATVVTLIVFAFCRSFFKDCLGAVAGHGRKNGSGDPHS